MSGLPGLDSFMKTLLKVDSLNVVYHNDYGSVDALRYLSFELGYGEILGVVGESGSGKSTLGNTLMRILPADTGLDGEAYLTDKGANAVNLMTMSHEEINHVRGREIGMIFQDPGASLNPVYTIGRQMIEFLKYKGQETSPKKASVTAMKSLEEAGLTDPVRILESYPHQLSGGQLQRVCIAQALSVGPKLLIADEPTSSLDVTVESRILNLLLKFKREKELGILFITHDLDIAVNICDRIAVICNGTLQDIGGPEHIIRKPKSEYTKKLLKAYNELC